MHWERAGEARIGARHNLSPRARAGLSGERQNRVQHLPNRACSSPRFHHPPGAAQAALLLICNMGNSNTCLDDMRRLRLAPPIEETDSWLFYREDGRGGQRSPQCVSAGETLQDSRGHAWGRGGGGGRGMSSGENPGRLPGGEGNSTPLMLCDSAEHAAHVHPSLPLTALPPRPESGG